MFKDLFPPGLFPKSITLCRIGDSRALNQIILLQHSCSVQCGIGGACGVRGVKKEEDRLNSHSYLS